MELALHGSFLGDKSPTARGLVGFQHDLLRDGADEVRRDTVHKLVQLQHSII